MASFSNTIAWSCLALVAHAAAQASSTMVDSSNFGDDAAMTTTLTGLAFPVTWPGGLGTQVLVGSVVAETSSIATIVITCANGADSDDCNVSPAATLTVGSTTLAWSYSDNDTDGPYTVTEYCSFDSTTGACSFSETGSASFFLTGDLLSSYTATATGLYTRSYTIDMASQDIVAAQVILTAGQTAGLSGLATVTAIATVTDGNENGGSSTVSDTRTTSMDNSSGLSSTSHTAGGHSGSTTTITGTSRTSSTATANDAKLLVPSTMAAGVMGLAILFL